MSSRGRRARPPVGSDLHYWIHLSSDDITARIIVRRQLAELYLAGKAGGLLLCSPPSEMPIPPNIGRLNMLHATPEVPSGASVEEPLESRGRFNFGTSSDTQDARPAGFGRGKGLITPLSRMKRLALTGAPPAADRTYSAVTSGAPSTATPVPTPKYTLPATGMPMRGTPEYEVERVKMAAVEDAQRAAAQARASAPLTATPEHGDSTARVDSSRKSSSRRSRKESIDSDDKPAQQPPRQGRSHPTNPAFFTSTASALPDATVAPAPVSAAPTQPSSGTATVAPAPVSAAPAQPSSGTATVANEPATIAAPTIMPISPDDLSALVYASDAFITLDDKLTVIASRIDYVESTIRPEISSALQQMEPMLANLQERTARMEEVMVEVRSLDHIAALKREIAALQRQL